MPDGNPSDVEARHVDGASTACAVFRARTLPIAAAVVVAAVVAGGCRRAVAPDRQAEEPAVVPVGVQPVEVGSIRTVVHASGVVTPAAGAEFLAVAPEPARVLEITRAVGEPVASGETLVRFEIPFATETLARAKADVERAMAQVENARASRARTREFVERGLLPRRDLESADRDVTDAEVDLARARSALAAADAAAARAIVRAPFDGVVVQRLHEPGDLVQASPGDPVLRLVDTGRLEVTATVPAADAARVLPGATARIAGAIDGKAVALRVAAAPERRGAGDTALVRLVFVEPPSIPVDTPVEVDVDADERTGVVFVGADALIHRDGRTLLFVAAGERAEQRTVTIGLTDGPRVEITAGVRPGELVITRGHIGLTDGSAITAAR